MSAIDVWDYPAMRQHGFRRPASGWRIAIGLLALSFAASACGNATITPSALPPTAVPTPSPSTGPSPTPEDPEAVYARIEQQVVAIRGLAELRPVTPQILDDAGLAKELTAKFDESYPPARVAAEQALDIGLGLLPPGDSLRDELFKLQTSQVAGFYETDTKKMFVVSKTGGLGPTEMVTFAHEFDHALQDQHFDLTKLGTNEPGQSDASLAHLSVAEGDATLLMYDWLQSALTPAQTLQLLQGSLNPTQTAILAAMPPFLHDQLLFPYTRGLSFIQTMYLNGGWPAIDALYTARPASTEQVMHVGKYVAHDAPISVTIPADVATRLGTGWTAPLQDTLGEFTLGEWLKVVGGLTDTDAANAAEGWGGDRAVVVTGPAGAWGVAMITRWDAPANADAFASAAQTTVQKRGHADVFRPVAGEVAVVIGSSDDIRARLANVLGFAG